VKYEIYLIWQLGSSFSIRVSYGHFKTSFFFIQLLLHPQSLYNYNYISIFCLNIT